MKALLESQRALDIERKLFLNERCLQLSQSENMKLRAKLDELKLKYEPEGMNVSYIFFMIYFIKGYFNAIYILIIMHLC